MTVYFVKSKETGHIKIGHTIQVEARMHALARDHGELEILGLLDGNLDTESDLHELFSAHNVEDAQGREWFEDCESIRDYIDSHCSMPDDIETVWMPLTRSKPKKVVTIRISEETSVLLHFFIVEHFITTGTRFTISEAIDYITREARPDLVSELERRVYSIDSGGQNNP